MSAWYSYRTESHDCPEGMEKDLVKSGDGPYPRVGQLATVEVTCFGRKGDPKKEYFTTRHPIKPAYSFLVGKFDAVKGLDVGVSTMRVGERARFWCTPEYGFDPSGISICCLPGDAPLLFDVELLKVEEWDFGDEEDEDEDEEEMEEVN